MDTRQMNLPEGFVLDVKETDGFSELPEGFIPEKELNKDVNALKQMKESGQSLTRDQERILWEADEAKPLTQKASEAVSTFVPTAWNIAKQLGTGAGEFIYKGILKPIDTMSQSPEEVEKTLKEAGNVWRSAVHGVAQDVQETADAGVRFAMFGSSITDKLLGKSDEERFERYMLRNANREFAQKVYEDNPDAAARLVAENPLLQKLAYAAALAQGATEEEAQMAKKAYEDLVKESGLTKEEINENVALFGEVISPLSLPGTNTATKFLNKGTSKVLQKTGELTLRGIAPVAKGIEKTAGGVEKLVEGAENLSRKIGEYTVGDPDTLLKTSTTTALAPAKIPAKMTRGIARTVADVASEAGAIGGPAGRRGLFERAGRSATAGDLTKKLFGPESLGGKGRARFADWTVRQANAIAQPAVNGAVLNVALGLPDIETGTDLGFMAGTGAGIGAYGGARLPERAYALIDPTTSLAQKIDAVLTPDPEGLRRDQDADIKRFLATADTSLLDSINDLSNLNNIKGALDVKIKNLEGRKTAQIRNEDAKRIQIEIDNLKNQRKALDKSTPQTEAEIKRQIQLSFADAMDLAKTTGAAAGLNNIQVKVLRPDQMEQFYRDLYGKTLTDAESVIQQLLGNPNMTPQEKQMFDMADQTVKTFLADVAGASTARGFAISESTARPEHLRYANQKGATVVINGDLVTQMGRDGLNLSRVINHEIQHGLSNFEEVRQMLAPLRKQLFDQKIQNPDGTFEVVSKGSISDAQLDAYALQYAAAMDASGGASFLGQFANQDQLRAYMKEEVLSELAGLSGASHGDLRGALDSTGRQVVDWLEVQSRNGALKKIKEGLRRFGVLVDDQGQFSSVLGAELTPEALAAMRQYQRKLRDLNESMVYNSDPRKDAPEITLTQIATNRALQERYKHSDFFEQQQVVVLTTPDGRKQEVVVPPGAKVDKFVRDYQFQGGRLVDSDGNPVSLGPDIPIFQTAMPDGTAVTVDTRIARNVDGSPRILSPREIKRRAKKRTEAIRKAIDEAPDDQSGVRLEDMGNGNYRGTLSPAQIDAINALPNDLVAPSLKRKIAFFNDILGRKDGTIAEIEYQAALRDGKYRAIQPQIRTEIPIGFQFSKDGNFLMTTMSMSRMHDKANAWAAKSPKNLRLWGGDMTKFWDSVRQYLTNHKAGLQGHIGLNPDPEIAMQMKNRINDLFNVYRKETREANPERTTLPKRRGQDSRDVVIRSRRMDRINSYDETALPKMPFQYELAVQNYLPAENPLAEYQSAEQFAQMMEVDPELARRAIGGDIEPLELQLHEQDLLRPAEYIDVRDGQIRVRSMFDPTQNVFVPGESEPEIPAMLETQFMPAENIRNQVIDAYFDEFLKDSPFDDSVRVEKQGPQYTREEFREAYNNGEIDQFDFEPGIRRQVASQFPGYFGQETQFSNATVTSPGVQFLPAYHGTKTRIPAEEGFQLKYVGTGQGKQAWGWGLYFATNPKVVERSYPSQFRYKVDLDLNPEDALDYDAPIDPRLLESAQQLSAEVGAELTTNGDYYEALSDKLGTPKDASMELLSMGIPAIRYLDGRSRSPKVAPEDKTYNYVVFDESKIKILDETDTLAGPVTQFMPAEGDFEQIRRDAIDKRNKSRDEAYEILYSVIPETADILKRKINFEDDQQEFNSIPFSMPSVGFDYDRSFHLTKIVRRILDTLDPMADTKAIQNLRRKWDTASPIDKQDIEDRIKKYEDRIKKTASTMKYAFGVFADLTASLPEAKARDLRQDKIVDPWVVLKKHFPDGESKDINKIILELRDIIKFGTEKENFKSSINNVLNAAEVLRDFTDVDQSVIDQLFKDRYNKSEAQIKKDEEKFFKEVTNPEFYDVEKRGTATFSQKIEPQGGVQFMPAESDVEYLRLAQDPEANREKLQRMVDEAAISKGIPITYPLFRGVRRKPKNGVMYTQGERATLSFTDVPEVAKLYTHKQEFGGITPSPYGSVKKVYLNIKNPLDIRSEGTKVNLGDFIDKYFNWDWRPEDEVIDDNVFSGDDLIGLLNRMSKLEASTNFESDIQSSDPDGIFRHRNFGEVASSVREIIDSSEDANDVAEQIENILSSIELDTYALADNKWVIKHLKDLGYDGLIHKDTIEAGKEFFQEESVAGKPIEEIKGINAEDDYSHDTWRPFNKEQIKLSDPVTYDNEGNVIPLSQRFQTTSPDIRFMPPEQESPEGMQGVEPPKLYPRTTELIRPLQGVEPPEAIKQAQGGEMAILRQALQGVESPGAVVVPDIPQVEVESVVEKPKEVPPDQSAFISEKALRKFDSLGDKNATQVDADNMKYPVNTNPDSVALPGRWGLVNAKITGMPKTFKEVSEIIDRQVNRLVRLVNANPEFAKESARFYRDMAESATMITDAAFPQVKGLEKYLFDELVLRFLALGSPRTSVASNATKSAGSIAVLIDEFEAGYKIGFGEQSHGAKTTYNAWKDGGHFDLSLPGVQDKVRTFYLNSLSELIEMAEAQNDSASVEELMLRAGKSMRVLDPDRTSKLSDVEKKEIQRLLDGKATVDMWDMAAKGWAWPGFLIFKNRRNSVKKPFQWSQDDFERVGTFADKSWKQVQDELKIKSPADLRYQQARALKIDGNPDWTLETWNERKSQPFPDSTKFSYYTQGTEAGLSPGGGGPLYDAQQAIDGLLADRLNELGLAPLFGKTKLKARNAQEILWALEKMDNPDETNNDLSLFGNTFEPFLNEVLKLRLGKDVDKESRAENVLAAMERAYMTMAEQLIPIEVVSSGTSEEAKRIQDAIKNLKSAGDPNPEKTITLHIADGLGKAVNDLAIKHGIKATIENVDIGDGGYTEEGKVAVAPNIRITLRGNPQHTFLLLETLSRAMDQDGGNVIRKPTMRELNDSRVEKNLILTIPTTGLNQAQRNKMFLDLSMLKDASGESFLTGFTEVEGGIAIGNQFYSGDYEKAILDNQTNIDGILNSYNQSPSKTRFETAIIQKFKRGQASTKIEPEKITVKNKKVIRPSFASDLYDYIKNRMTNLPLAGSTPAFAQKTDFANNWIDKADALFARLKSYPVKTKPQKEKAKLEAPDISTNTKRTTALVDLKAELESGVLRDLISEDVANKLKARYGFKKEKQPEGEE